MNEIRNKHAALARMLGRTKSTIGGITYDCDQCSWHVSSEEYTYGEAVQLFEKHDCAENPPEK